jgi:hypothetical protein
MGDSTFAQVSVLLRVLTHELALSGSGSQFDALTAGLPPSWHRCWSAGGAAAGRATSGKPIDHRGWAGLVGHLCAHLARRGGESRLAQQSLD